MASSAPKASERALLESVAQRGPLSRHDLSVLTGLPFRTVSAAAARLLTRGLLEEVDAEQAAASIRAGDTRERGGRGGRPPALLRNPNATPYAAVLLSHHQVRVALFGADGTVTAPIRSQPLRWPDCPDLPADLADLVEAAVADETGSGSARPEHVVVGVPMPYVPGAGITLLQTGKPTPPMRGPADYPAWVHTDLAAAVSGHLQLPVTVENDVNLCALGEAVDGAGSGADNVLFLKVGGALAAGIVIGGNLVRGALGAAGELGHLHVDPAGPLCYCGARGCLGLSATANRLAETLAPLYGSDLPLFDLLGLAAQGDLGVRRTLDDVGREVGAALAPAVVMLNPDCIVVDGALGPAAAPVIEGLRDSLSKAMPLRMFEATRVVVGALSEDADIHGAAVIARRAPHARGRG